MAAKTLVNLTTEPSRCTHALRYDDLVSGLMIRDEQLLLPSKRSRTRDSGVILNELEALRADLAAVKAENKWLTDRLTDGLDELAERLSNLEAHAHRAWWRRAFAPFGQKVGLGGRTKAITRLRALSLRQSDPKRPVSVS